MAYDWLAAIVSAILLGVLAGVAACKCAERWCGLYGGRWSAPTVNAERQTRHRS